MKTEEVDMFVRQWYEQAKADDPHHFEEHEDCRFDSFCIVLEYTFESFEGCPIVAAFKKTLHRNGYNLATERN